MTIQSIQIHEPYPSMEKGFFILPVKGFSVNGNSTRETHTGYYINLAKANDFVGVFLNKKWAKAYSNSNMKFISDMPPFE